MPWLALAVSMCFTLSLNAQANDFDQVEDDYFTETEPEDNNGDLFEENRPPTGDPHADRRAGFGGLFFAPQAAPDAFTRRGAVELAPSLSYFGGEPAILGTYLRGNYGYADDLLFAGEFDYAARSAPSREFFDELACPIETSLPDFGGGDPRAACRENETVSRFSLGADWSFPLTESELQLSLGGRFVYSARRYGGGPALIPRITATVFVGELRLVPWLGAAFGEHAGLEVGAQFVYPVTKDWDVTFEAAYLSGGGGSFGRAYDETWLLAAPGVAWRFSEDVNLQLAVPLGFGDAPEYGVSVRFSTVFKTDAP